MNEKYFLCFGFPNFSASDLRRFHVTMIHFGSGDADLQAIMREVDHFFDSDLTRPALRLPIEYTEKALFGREKNIPVLLPSKYTRSFLETYFLKKLRDRLELYQTSPDFPFNPHLSAELDYFRSNISTLYLCGKSYRVLREWALHD